MAMTVSCIICNYFYWMEFSAHVQIPYFSFCLISKVDIHVNSVLFSTIYFSSDHHFCYLLSFNFIISNSKVLTQFYYPDCSCYFADMHCSIEMIDKCFDWHALSSLSGWMQRRNSIKYLSCILSLTNVLEFNKCQSG